MCKKKKKSLWLTGALLVFLVVFSIVFPYIAPKFFNSQAIKTKLETTISEQIGGRVQFESMGFSVFPLPHVVIHQGIVSIPNTATGSVNSLAAYPELIPLLWAQVRINELHLEAPEIFIKLPFPTDTPIDFDGIKQKVLTAVRALATNVTDLDIEIDEGRLTLTATDGSLLSFDDVDAVFELSPKQFKIDLDSKSNLSESVAIHATLEPGPLIAKGTVELEGFHPLILSRYVPALADYRIIEPIRSFKINFLTKGLTDLLAKLRSSKLILTAFKRSKQTTVIVKSLKSSIELNERTRSVTIDTLELESPRLSLSGTLKAQRDTSIIDLKLKVNDFDLLSTRAVALTLAGDDPDVQDIFQFVRGGTIPSMTITSQAKSWKGLDSKEALVIRGKLSNGNIYIPAVDLNFEDVDGDVVISQGVLEGSNVAARLLKTRGENGKIRVGLTGPNPLLNVEIEVTTDLSEVPPLITRLINDDAIKNELQKINDAKGEVQGKLILGDRVGSLNVRVDLSKVNVSASYRPLPFPLQIKGGQISYNETGVNVDQLRGQMGRSTFSNLKGSLNLKRESFLTIESGRTSFVLEDIYPWLLSFKNLAPELDAVTSAKGAILLSSIDLKGPILSLEKWRYNLNGELDDLVIESKLLPGPMKITSGFFKASPEEIVVNNINAQMADARIKVSGILPSPIRRLEKAEVTLSGDLGAEATAWLSDLMNLPPQLHVRSPMSFSPSQLQWQKGKQISFKGDLTINNGPQLSLDIEASPQELTIKNLTVRDDESNASLGMRRSENEYAFNFNGTLTQGTTGKILVNTPQQNEWLRGNFRAHIFLDYPANSRIHGTLEGKGLGFLKQFNVPLIINDMAVSANGKRLDFKSMALTSEQHKGNLQGSISAAEDAFVLNLDLTLNQLNWGKLKERFPSKSQSNNGREKSKFWDLPVRGTVRLKSDSFLFGDLTWSPLHADISRLQDSISIAVNKAALCGISSTGTLTIDPDDLSWDFSLLAKDEDYEKTTRCLGYEQRRGTGTFDFDAKFKAQGKSNELIKTATGKLEFISKKGRIYEFSMLAKALALVNLTELFRGKVPDLRKEGFSFDSIIAKGDLKDGKIDVTEFLIDGSSMDIIGTGEVDLMSRKLNFKLFIAPFKTINALTQRTPIIRNILGGNILSVPITVKGDLGNPEVAAAPSKP